MAVNQKKKNGKKCPTCLIAVSKHFLAMNSTSGMLQMLLEDQKGESKTAVNWQQIVPVGYLALMWWNNERHDAVRLTASDLASEELFYFNRRRRMRTDQTPTNASAAWLIMNLTGLRDTDIPLNSHCILSQQQTWMYSTGILCDGSIQSSHAHSFSCGCRHRTSTRLFWFIKGALINFSNISQIP